MPLGIALVSESGSHLSEWARISPHSFRIVLLAFVYAIGFFKYYKYIYYKSNIANQNYGSLHEGGTAAGLGHASRGRDRFGPDP
jgi:hypothetical protein